MCSHKYKMNEKQKGTKRNEKGQKQTKRLNRNEKERKETKRLNRNKNGWKEKKNDEKKRKGRKKTKYTKWDELRKIWEEIKTKKVIKFLFLYLK